MTFSFVTAALTFWLGFVAIACLHRIWRGTTGHSIDMNSRDRSCGSRQAYRDYPRSELAADGLLPLLQRSLGCVLGFLQRAVRAAITQSSKLLSKIFCRQAMLHAFSPPATSPITQVIDSRLPANDNEGVAIEPSSGPAEKGGGMIDKTCAQTRASPRISDRKRARNSRSTGQRSSTHCSEKRKAVRVSKGSSTKATRSQRPQKRRPTVKPPLRLKPSV